MQAVRKIDELEGGLDLVIAVRSAAGHVQEQVQLGRRGPGRGAHGGSCQSETATRSRSPCVVISIRCGSASAPTVS